MAYFLVSNLSFAVSHPPYRCSGCGGVIRGVIYKEFVAVSHPLIILYVATHC